MFDVDALYFWYVGAKLDGMIFIHDQDTYGQAKHIKS